MSNLKDGQLHKKRREYTFFGGGINWPAEIGGAFYINLNHRKDRRQEFENRMTSIGGPPVERFPGIKRKPGILGCGLTHLAILKEAKLRGYKSVLIFEDDFCPVVSPKEFWSSLQKFFDLKIQYDVLMLSHNIQRSEPYNNLLVRVLEAQTASAYIVNQSAYDTLIQTLEIGMTLLEQTGMHWIYANDQIWKKVQPQLQWFAFEPRLGKQCKSYSDNGEVVSNYKV
jgi:GR25 family glycosyltransferase involved in LPS biosynthesis